MKSNDFKRLHWACRRGMLELDVLLEKFLYEKYSNLTIEQQAQFEELLKIQDQDLFNWFMRKEIPPVEFSVIVEEILHHAQHNANV